MKVSTNVGLVDKISELFECQPQIMNRIYRVHLVWFSSTYANCASEYGLYGPTFVDQCPVATLASAALTSGTRFIDTASVSYPPLLF